MRGRMIQALLISHRTSYLELSFLGDLSLTLRQFLAYVFKTFDK